MQLNKIRLKQFRNFESASFSFSPALTVIIGENAKGKTNILEAICFLLVGSGFREHTEDELIVMEENQLEAEGIFTIDSYTLELHIILREKEDAIEKIFVVNRAKKKLFQYQKETTRAVLFSPEQIQIITESPDRRREYFDEIISLYKPEHKKRLFNYGNALRKRNKLLEQHTNIQTLREELTFWNRYLEEQAAVITRNRREYVEFLNEHSRIDNKKFRVEYVSNELTAKRLEEVFDRERIYRKTFIGPQKDDFRIFLKGEKFEKDLHCFGSRSEQRLGVFWLKMNEIYHHEAQKKKPILLLDDIFSELDLKNKKLIFHLIENYQTVLTTTQEELLDISGVEKEIIRL